METLALVPFKQLSKEIYTDFLWDFEEKCPYEMNALSLISVNGIIPYVN
jgi:hypothetical protein